MKKPVSPTQDANRFVVLHRAGRDWKALLVNRSGSRPTVLEHRTFEQSRASEIDRWIVQTTAAQALCVLPAASIICRTVPLPDAPIEQLAPALHLQAEAHLLGIAPPHRVAMSVLSATPGESNRSGLVLAWPESSEFLAPVTSVPVRYIGDVAAVAALLNGERPAQPLLWLDRHDGSVAVAISHSGGVTFRATHEEPEPAESWSRSIGRIVAETALGVGHSGGFIESIVQDARTKAASLDSDHAGLFVPSDVAESASGRVSGVGKDLDWWTQYGVAAGAAIAEAGSLAPLTSLLHTPPVQQPSRIRSALEAMSRPRSAATIVVGCIVLLMLAPLLFSALRLAALKVRYGDLSEPLAVADASRNQIAVYRELEKQGAWPMTKILSDIATNAPLGIELEIMRVDAGKDFSVSGTAIGRDGKTASEIVAEMVTNLRTDSIFVDPALQWGDANNLGVLKFDITGKVKSPYHAANYPPVRDFLAWTHEDRRDGKPMPGGGKPSAAPARPSVNEVDETNAAAATDGDPVDEEFGSESETEMLAATSDAQPGDDAGSSSPSPVESSPRRPSNLGGGGAGADPTQAGSGTASAGRIPEPISEEQIKLMSREELSKALAENSRARTYARGNQEVEDRLKKEFNMIMEQLRALREGGGK